MTQVNNFWNKLQAQTVLWMSRWVIFRCTSSPAPTRNPRNRATNLLRVQVGATSWPALTLEMCPRVATATTPRTVRAWFGPASCARGGRPGSGWTAGSPPPSGRGRGSGRWVSEWRRIHILPLCCTTYPREIRLSGGLLFGGHILIFSKLLVNCQYYHSAIGSVVT